MILNTIFNHNNITVDFLQQQDFRNAVLSSVSVLQEMKQLQEESSAVDDSSAAGNNNTRYTQGWLDQCMLQADVNSSICSESTTDMFVYERGISIPLASSGQQSMETISSILIFNSAIAHHLYAEQNQDKDIFQRYLLKANTLYELALRNDRDVGQNILFQFVVMNNIATIKSQLGNDEKLSSQYFEHLLSIFMLLVEQGASSKLCHLRGFLRNVPFQFQTAPAA